MSDYMENFQQDSPLEYMVLTKFQERISGEHHFADLGTKKYWLMARHLRMVRDHSQGRAVYDQADL